MLCRKPNGSIEWTAPTLSRLAFHRPVCGQTTLVPASQGDDGRLLADRRCDPAGTPETQFARYWNAGEHRLLRTLQSVDRARLVRDDAVRSGSWSGTGSDMFVGVRPQHLSRPARRRFTRTSTRWAERPFFQNLPRQFDLKPPASTRLQSGVVRLHMRPGHERVNITGIDVTPIW